MKNTYVVQKSKPCDTCGKPTRRRMRDTRLATCADCSADRYAETMRQISAKSGPYYDAWLDGMIAAIRREARARVGGGNLL